MRGGTVTARPSLPCRRTSRPRKGPDSSGSTGAESTGRPAARPQVRRATMAPADHPRCGSRGTGHPHSDLGVPPSSGCSLDCDRETPTGCAPVPLSPPPRGMSRTEGADDGHAAAGLHRWRPAGFSVTIGDPGAATAGTPRGEPRRQLEETRGTLHTNRAGRADTPSSPPAAARKCSRSAAAPTGRTCCWSRA